MMPLGISKKSKAGLLQNERPAFTGSKFQGFKVEFSSLACNWDEYLREKRQLRWAKSKIWS